MLLDFAMLMLPVLHARHCRDDYFRAITRPGFDTPAKYDADYYAIDSRCAPFSMLDTMIPPDAFDA